MFARISLFIVLMTWGLLLTVAPVRAQEDVTAAQLFRQGMQLFERQDYAKAREVLRRVDGAQLPREDRVTLWETLRELDLRTAGGGEAAPAAEEAPAQPVNRLQQADELTRRGQSAEAISLYEQVLNDPDASEADKTTAAARLAELSRRRNPDLTRARQLIAEAQADLDAGRLDVAYAKLTAVANSDVRLSSFDRGRVERQLALIQERRAALGELAAAVEPAPIEPVQPQARPQTQPQEPAAPQRPANGQQDLLTQARILHVQRLIAEGRQAEQQGNYRVAVASYQQAVQLDPQNAAAREALAAATVKAQEGASEQGLLDQHTVQQNIRREAALAEYEAQMNAARRSLEQGNFARATEAVEQAKRQLDQNQRLFATVTYEDLRNKAIELDATIRQRQLIAEGKVREEDAAAAARQEEANRRQQMLERQMEVQRLLQRVAALRREQQYEQALRLLDQVLFLDPTNVAAATLKEMIEDSVLYDEFNRAKRRRDLEIAGQRLDDIEATTPYRAIMTYPVDWPQLTQRRLSQFQTGSEESEVNRATRVQLRQPTQVNFEGIQLGLVIDYLRNITGLNFYVNWPALEAAGVSQDTPINLQLSNVPAEQALKLVLQQAGASAFGEQIGYSVIDGIVQISTLADLNRTVDIRIYDIRDLLVQVPNFTNAPEFDLENALDSSQTGSGRGTGGGGSSGSGRSLFDTDDDDDEEEQLSRAERINQILELIQNTVGRPEEWEFFGGDVSSVRELNGNLIVRTTPDNHRQTMALLDQLREALALQINIEARFLAVSQNFLNEFGIDLDFNITNELTDNNLSDITVDQDSLSLADRPTTILTPAAFGLVSGGAEEEGAFRRSFQMGLSYMDDLEVSLLIRATQAHRRAISLTAPRLTLFNGQRAYVMVARQIAFISDLEPIPDTLGFDVTPGVVNSGVVLDVEATVSADRRYVTLTLRPSLATVVQPIRQLPVSGAGVAGGGDGNGGIPVEGASAFIELPEVELTQVRTTVSVPDKGTLLLGGQRLVGEIEVEAGVPVLSKIPVLNRLFTNRSMVKDEATLLILVKPTIIIQSEEEDLEFPNLMDDPQRWGAGTGFFR